MVHLWVRSLGCKVNLADLAEALEVLLPSGLLLVRDPERADLALVHTCTVTHKADSDVRKILGSLRTQLPGLPVILSGCAVAATPEAFASFANVKAMVKPSDAAQLAKTVASLMPLDPGADAVVPDAFRSLRRHRAVLKIQDGCNAFCTYCVVPYVRGRERSLPMDQVVAKTLQFFKKGYHEVVLVGIHLGRYGQGQDGSLTQLLQRLEQAAWDPACARRIRLSSIEPMEWTGPLIDFLARSKLVCPHFHIPLQSGDDGILQAMGRPYRADHFAQVVHALAQRFPRAALGTDILTGFPGETDEAAHNTLNLVKQLPLAYFHVFTYSARPQTKAASLPMRVPTDTVKHRSAQLRALGRDLWSGFLQQGLGQVHQVLLEKSVNGWLEGRSEAYRRVCLQDSPAHPGDMVLVSAQSIHEGKLHGTWIEAGEEGTCRIR